MKPNLFHFATSELSQDAMLCWLLSWAKPECKSESAHLHALAVQLFERFFSKVGLPFPAELTSVEVRRQQARIDVLCLVNSEIAVLIEDKVGSIQHSDQLSRYKDYVINQLGIVPDKILPLYIQTGDQGNFDEVLKSGFTVIERSELLDVLESHVGGIAATTSDILGNYRQYLRGIEDDVRSFLTTPLPSWSRNAWKGFYSDIKKMLKDGEWDYVPNQEGGFLGYWWYFSTTLDADVYLQLEQNNFCFKICPYKEVNRQQARLRWHKLIMQSCDKAGMKARRPGRFGLGAYMTVALLEGHYRQTNADGRIDMDETLKVLLTAQKVIDGAVEMGAQQQTASCSVSN